MLPNVSVGKVHCTHCAFSISSRSVCVSHCMHTTLLLSFSISSTIEWNTSYCWDTGKFQSLHWLTGGALTMVLSFPFLWHMSGAVSAIFHGPFPSCYNPCQSLLVRATVCPTFFFYYGETVWSIDHYSSDNHSCRALNQIQRVRCKPRFSCVSVSSLELIDFCSSTSRIFFGSDLALKSYYTLSKVRLRPLGV